MSPVEFLSSRLIPAAIFSAVARAFDQALLWLVRPSSPQARRIAWACVLFSGIVVFPIPINIPDHPPNATPLDRVPAMVEMRSDARTESGSPPALAPRFDLPVRDLARPFSADDGPRFHCARRRPSRVAGSGPGRSRISQPLGRPVWWQAAFAAWAFGGRRLLGLGGFEMSFSVRTLRRAFEPASGEWDANGGAC